MQAGHEEYSEIGSFWSWAIVILFCVVIVGWGIFNYLTIPDPPRKWDLGALRDTPSQSIYSTAKPGPRAAGREQIAPLPEGEPLEGGAHTAPDSPVSNRVEGEERR